MKWRYPVGWRYESVRHSLAARGVKTGVRTGYGRKYMMTLTNPTSNSVSATTREGYKILKRDDGETSPYVEMQILEGSGIGGANDRKGYHYVYLEMFKWANGRKSDERKRFESVGEARELMDSIDSYEKASRIMKEWGEEE